MRASSLNLGLLLCTVPFICAAQRNPEQPPQRAPAQVRASLASPVVLATDDVRAPAAAPAGFADAQHDISHVRNVDEYGHDRESWAYNLYHFAQRVFQPMTD